MVRALYTVVNIEVSVNVNFTFITNHSLISLFEQFHVAIELLPSCFVLVRSSCFRCKILRLVSAANTYWHAVTCPGYSVALHALPFRCQKII